ncbi:MAG TPA: hypothetical protein DD426_06300 [Clostridiaceae bacterium]|nr:hypothetical protein [Clostridiaceae bacterium]
MNFFTHIAISKILYNHLKSQMELNKTDFIYGNIKPDLTRRVLKKPHILDNYLDYVCDGAGNLMKGEVPLEEFSIELGEICHYVCDFFCRYHLNIEIFNNLKGHFFYELRLHFVLLRLSREEKSEMEINNKKANRDIESIISAMRADYFSETAAFKKDISYAISTAIWVCESVVYFMARSTGPASNNDKIDSYVMVPSAGGK